MMRKKNHILKVKDEYYEDAEAVFSRGLDLGIELGLSYRMRDFEASFFSARDFGIFWDRKKVLKKSAKTMYFAIKTLDCY